MTIHNIEGTPQTHTIEAAAAAEAATTVSRADGAAGTDTAGAKKATGTRTEASDANCEGAASEQPPTKLFICPRAVVDEMASVAAAWIGAAINASVTIGGVLKSTGFIRGSGGGDIAAALG
jgi:hypothetical protein